MGKKPIDFDVFESVQKREKYPIRGPIVLKIDYKNM